MFLEGNANVERRSADPAHSTEGRNRTYRVICAQLTVRLVLGAMHLVAMRAARVVTKARPGTQVGVPRITKNVHDKP